MIDYIAVGIRSSSIGAAEKELAAKIRESLTSDSEVRYGLKKPTKDSVQMRGTAGLSAVKKGDIRFETTPTESWLVKFLGFRDELVKLSAKAEGFTVSELPHNLRAIPQEFRCSEEYSQP